MSIPLQEKLLPHALEVLLSDGVPGRSERFGGKSRHSCQRYMHFVAQSEETLVMLLKGILSKASSPKTYEMQMHVRLSAFRMLL